MNNLDKHRLLVPIAHINTARTETAAEPEKSRESWAREHPNEIFIAADIRRIVPTEEPSRVLKAGDVIYRIPSELNEEPKLLIEIAFDEAGVAEGEPLIPTLHQIKMQVIYTLHSMFDLL